LSTPSRFYIMRYMLQPPTVPGLDGDVDADFKKAVEVMVQYDRASAALLQRRLSIGYARAARLIDQLESAGVLGPADGAKPREVLIRSSDEILEKEGASQEKQDDLFEVPSNYKVPESLNLSKGDKIYQGEYISDVVNSRVLKETKIGFPLPLGFDEKGKLFIESLLNVRNLIIAGNPLSQKENLVDTILLTNLLRYAPQKLRIILNDLTHYLDLYNGIPHLLSPVINEYSKVVSAFKWSLAEMDRRLKQFAQAGVRNIASYNEMAGALGLPHILLITFFNFFDIETEDALTMLTGQGVRAGIHNIIIVERTNGKSLSTNIKSNIPARVVFRLSSVGESKAIDVLGAEKLEPGEIIYKPNYGSTAKLKAVFTPEVNVKEVVEAVKKSVISS
jgi:DNA segregation ATPase FtsK/SpoIIIE-like protein